MTAFLNLSSMMRVIVLFSCTVTYCKPLLSQVLRKDISKKENTQGLSSVVYIGTVVGERLSPYLSILCLYYSLHVIISLVW
ncbi:hypothetical protein NEDG_00439 [Nematocida displodere]|uniref:Protein kish n=1 Tax=Nematocida displodere TaxID=1805483 RepID=A0A177EJ10_9MICR|nr:hypothetical protein NEDG_00439 [Nematocida displodere]